MLRAAIAAAHPAQCMAPYLPERPQGKLVVVGAGKAAGAMAQIVEAHYDGYVEGCIAVPAGTPVQCAHISVYEATHPVPDDTSITAARAALAAVSDLGPDDLVLCLISGGGSALWALPAAGVSLGDKQAVTTALLASGASIAEINLVRRHLSAIKGGKLLGAAQPARVVTLAISDVPGDEPAIIASGPTVPDTSSPEDALGVLSKYAIATPPSIAEALLQDPLPLPPVLPDFRLIARPADALAAAEHFAKERGYEVRVLGDAVEGEAQAVGRQHAQLAHEAGPTNGGLVLLSGGELTVRHDDTGEGGPNHEYVLAAALAFEGRDDVWVMAADTDGLDGTSGAAGACLCPAQLIGQEERAKTALASHQTGSFMAALGCQLHTGPTQTNVNDIRAIILGSGAPLA